MTDEERKEEGTGESIEDLEAPADKQDDVAGGKCPSNSMLCQRPTCWDTQVNMCKGKATYIVVHEE
ncbi:MAG TPA: hypothetical protein VGI67_02735 [Thermoleophilaceae bacterium]